MDDSVLPSLNQATRRLAADNRRVMRFLNSLPDQIDELIRAATADDWAEVRRLGDFLAISSDVYGISHVGAAARQLCDACKGQYRHEAKRWLLRVIGSVAKAEPVKNLSRCP
jgi:HPt (histidine-containing phosphotransfer) domain-containing protein